MVYFNHDRGQWNLKKLPPAKYRQLLQEVAYFFSKCPLQGVLFK
ncbi:hypothetical protein [Peribacillus faecalis]|nr:hypothetical protein [Peribacillus faecalis]